MTPMRALVAQAIGELADVVGIEARDRPAPGPGQILAQVLAAPVQPSDLHIIRGRCGYSPELPAVLGAESVGVAAELGEGATGLSPGQRVVTVG